MSETQFRCLYRKPSLCGLEAFAVDLTLTAFQTAVDLWSWPDWRARVAIIRDRLGLAPVREVKP